VDEKIKEEIDHNDDTPPVLGSWGKIYTLVFFNLVILVILFYYFTRIFE
jgi:hypothetical protein